MIKQLIFLWKKFTMEIYKFDIDYQEIETTIKRLFPDSDLEITDIRKKTCDYSTLKELSYLIPVRYKKYQKEVFDCEDFAIIAWGIWKAFFPRLPIGLAFVKTNIGLHAMNCAIYKTEKGTPSFTFIEPQNGKVSFYDVQPYKIII